MKLNLLSSSLFAVLLTVAFSCAKKNSDPQPSTNQTPTITKDQAIKVLNNLKFSFSDPSSGNYQYSSTNGWEYTEPSGTKYYTPESGKSTYQGPEFSLAGNIAQGGGEFLLDGKTVSLDYVFCISADNKEFGAAFGTAPAGFSMLVGVAGNFEMGSSEPPKFEYLVVTFVNDDKAQGNYKILLAKDTKDASGKTGYMIVSDFSKVDYNDPNSAQSDVKLYVSTSGSLEVSNGNIGLNDLKFDDEDGKEVSAAGTLSCE